MTSEPAGRAEPADPAASDASRPERRELGVALALAAGGGVLALLAAGRTWVSVRQPGALPPLDVRYSGSALDGAASTLGLLGLAAVPALLATRRNGRVVLGALLALVGLLTMVAVVAAARAASDPYPRAAEGVVSSAGGPVDTTLTLWPWVAVFGCLLVLAAGMLTLLRGRRWAALSAKYDRVAAEAPAAPVEDVTGAQGWAALDRGEDPTG